MTRLEQLQEKNKNRKIYTLDDPSFATFGRVLDIQLEPQLKEFMLKEAKFPEARNVYVASDARLETSDLKQWVEANIYSGMESQFGYCNGLVSNINGFEFHQCSEVFIAVTDCVLALIKAHTPVGDAEPYHMDKSFLYYLPEGTVIEMYPMTGHFSPLRVNEEGYRTVIILQKGTNEALGQNTSLDSDDKNVGFAKNKWLYVHEDRMDLVEKGAHLHVYGDNSPIVVL